MIAGMIPSSSLFNKHIKWTSIKMYAYISVTIQRGDKWKRNEKKMEQKTTKKLKPTISIILSLASDSRAVLIWVSMRRIKSFQ